MACSSRIYFECICESYICYRYDFIHFRIRLRPAHKMPFDTQPVLKISRSLRKCIPFDVHIVFPILWQTDLRFFFCNLGRLLAIICETVIPNLLMNTDVWFSGPGRM